MKKQQKTETPQNTTNTTKTSPFLDKNVISANKIMKNEANLNRSKFTATTCYAMVYNALHPKTQNGTKPNEANLKPILARRPPGVVTSTKTGNSAILKNLFLRNKANFNSVKLTVTSCSRVGYNALHPKTQNGTNPIKANLKKPIYYDDRSQRGFS